MRFRFARSVLLAAFVSVLPEQGWALDWPDVAERAEQGLGSADPVSRRVAARTLGALATARATPLILRALSDPDTEVRTNAASAAIHHRITEAADVTLTWLAERDVKLRVKACEVALAMPSPRAVPQLARALSDTDPVVRGACADALGVQGTPDAVVPLSGKIDDPTPAVRSQVARALARLGDSRAIVPLVGKVQDSVVEVRRDVIRALGQLGDPRATQALLLALRDTAIEVKIEALNALGRLRAESAVSAIAPLALERNPSTRQAALAALGHIRTPDAVRALIKALGTHEDATATSERTSVRDALVSTGALAIAELTALLERPLPPGVATSAAWVLGELHAKKSASTLVTALRTGSLPPRAALRALAGAGTAEQVPVVLEYVSDPSPDVREEARSAAAALLDPSYPDGRAVEPLVAALRAPHNSPSERAAVAILLGRTGAPRAASELVGLVHSKDAALRLAAIDALGALGTGRGKQRGSKANDVAVDTTLVPLIGDADPAARIHAAVALAKSGGIDARASLQAMLDTGEVDRYALLTALGGISERFPDAAVAKRLFDELNIAAGPERDAVLEAAGRARLPSVVRALDALSKSPDADDRRIVAAVLGLHRGSQPALAIVRAMTRDMDESVRAQAVFTLGTIGEASDLSLLATLAKSGDVGVATNAAGGVARYASSAGPSAQRAIVAVACPLLEDGRGPVRANALVALAFVRGRCGTGLRERNLASSDPSELVRASAARALVAAPAPDDRVLLARCAASDQSSIVARLCASEVSRAPVEAPSVHAMTVFVFGEVGDDAKPHTPFMLEYEGGILRMGTTDRRGATFEAAAPEGLVTLRAAAR